MKRTNNFRQLYRQLRLIVRSYFLLPAQLKIVANSREALISSRGYPTTNVALMLKYNGLLRENILDYEPDERAVIEPTFKTTHCFWDIGAQIGFYSIFAALYGISHIYAFDLDKRYCEEIKKHSKRNRFDIKVLNIALGLDDKIVRFENYGATTKSLSSSIDKMVDLINIKPDLVKIDIDGGELDVLRGGKNLFSSSDAPTVFIEQYNAEYEIEVLMREYGYNTKHSGGGMTLWTKTDD